MAEMQGIQPTLEILVSKVVSQTENIESEIFLFNVHS